MKSFQRERTSFLRNSTHMQGSEKKYLKKKWTSVLIKKGTIMFTRRRKYFYKKYKDFQFFMIKEWKASKKIQLIQLEKRHCGPNASLFSPKTSEWFYFPKDPAVSLFRLGLTNFMQKIQKCLLGTQEKNSEQTDKQTNSFFLKTNTDI